MKTIIAAFSIGAILALFTAAFHEGWLVTSHSHYFVLLAGFIAGAIAEAMYRNDKDEIKLIPMQKHANKYKVGDKVLVLRHFRTTIAYYAWSDSERQFMYWFIDQHGNMAKEPESNVEPQ